MPHSSNRSILHRARWRQTASRVADRRTGRILAPQMAARLVARSRLPLRRQIATQFPGPHLRRPRPALLSIANPSSFPSTTTKKMTSGIPTSSASIPRPSSSCPLLYVRVSASLDHEF
ncbi:hypothetical protein JIQ42_02367 [Leishmania sp. Namibia]|uniref:hypothetical protein n=1 Tax=Leishmania sp. Namibia TaxID=2802991 RepID=UPI001B481867|nr:hypothetical protein JIQ42_02367 [Leishmania sp. Namibia]